MKIFVGILGLFVVLFAYVEGHGRLLDPPGRSTRWRTNSSAPINYDDHSLYCGGYGVQWSVNGGKCGICGDDYGIAPPRPNELGGRYGEGVIVKNYGGSERTADVTIEIETNHLGYIYYNLCNMDNQVIETEECYQANRLKLTDGSDRLDIGSTTGRITTTVIFPEGLSCKHCVLRWTYNAGNNWGNCDNGGGAMGCGAQENFKSCADISINASAAKAFSDNEPQIPLDV